MKPWVGQGRFSWLLRSCRPAPAPTLDGPRAGRHDPGPITRPGLPCTDRPRGGPPSPTRGLGRPGRVSRPAPPIRPAAPPFRSAGVGDPPVSPPQTQLRADADRPLV